MPLPCLVCYEALWYCDRSFVLHCWCWRTAGGSRNGAGSFQCLPRFLAIKSVGILSVLLNTATSTTLCRFPYGASEFCFPLILLMCFVILWHCYYTRGFALSMTRILAVQHTDLELNHVEVWKSILAHKHKVSLDKKEAVADQGRSFDSVPLISALLFPK